MADPMYRQIAEDLRGQIESGALAPAGQLPTEIQLRETHGASRNTVRDAIKWLTALGLVETRPGQGTFVTRRINPFTTKLSNNKETGDTTELDVYFSSTQRLTRHIEVTEPRVEIMRAKGDLASQLDITEGLPVISRRQRLSIDGIPWSIQTTFYNMDFVNQGALQLIETTNLPEGSLSYLKDALQIIQSSWRDLIMARQPNRNEIEFFGLPDSGQVPVFEIQRTGFDKDGRPIRLTITVFPADRNRFIYEDGDPPALPDSQASTTPDDFIVNLREDDQQN